LSGSLSTPSAKQTFIPPTAFQSIETFTVSGTSTTVLTFSSIPQTFKHLQVRGVVRVSPSSYYETAAMRFNASSGGTDYNILQLRNNGNTAEATNYITHAEPSISLNYLAGANTTAGTFSPFILDLFDYTDTNKKRNGKYVMGYENNGVGSTNYDKGMTTVTYWNWQQTAAINEIRINTVSGYFIEGTRLALYGITG
jgi:uncharacterized protein with PQ loop repeat